MAPAPVPAYSVQFYLDRDNSGTLGAGDAPAVGGSQAGQTSPGVYVIQQSFAGDPPAGGQFMFFVIDPLEAPNVVFGVVDEIDDVTNNLAATQNTDVTDLAAISLVYDSPLRRATLSYAVNSPVPVGAYNIRFYLDDGNGMFDPGLDTELDNVPGATAPGFHTAFGDYSFPAPGTGDVIFALLDSANAVAESSELNNLAEGVNNDPTDLVAISLAYDSNTQEATLSYLVGRPGCGSVLRDCLLPGSHRGRPAERRRWSGRGRDSRRAGPGRPHGDRQLRRRRAGHGSVPLRND
ncbi:MAG: hypothetical protein V3T70_01755 [Phycisphaerae bacterium]